MQKIMNMGNLKFEISFVLITEVKEFKKIYLEDYITNKKIYELQNIYRYAKNADTLLPILPLIKGLEEIEKIVIEILHVKDLTLGKIKQEKIITYHKFNINSCYIILKYKKNCNLVKNLFAKFPYIYLYKHVN